MIGQDGRYPNTEADSDEPGLAGADSMRLLVDTLIALMLVGILGTMLAHRSAEARQLDRVGFTRQNMSRIISTALYHASLHEVEVSGRGFPLGIEEIWFSSPPRNMLVKDARAWIDVTAQDSAGLMNPLTLIVDEGRAEFWYNPYRGILRARVPRQMTDRGTVELYNLVNGTALPTDRMITSVVETHDWP